MPVARVTLLGLLVSCFIMMNACSQTSANHSSTGFYVGSTPCDSLIRSILKIPADQTCDFIKWELHLSHPDNFHLQAVYGASKPNTNGFINGTNITVTGNYTTRPDTTINTSATLYQLHSEKFLSPLLLIELDSSIMHFSDANKNLLVGNGGWGYVLNRSNE